MWYIKNGIFRIKWGYCGQNGLFWTIEEYSYFGLISYCIIFKDIRYIFTGLKHWICVRFHWLIFVNTIYKYNYTRKYYGIYSGVPQAVPPRGTKFKASLLSGGIQLKFFNRIVLSRPSVCMLYGWMWLLHDALPISD